MVLRKKLEFAYGAASSYEPSIRQGGLKLSLTAQIIHSSFSVKRFETLEESPVHPGPGDSHP